MKSTKFLWSGVVILVVLLFASYLIPNFYFARSGKTKGVNNPSNDGSINNNYNRWGNGASG
jgi:hypothetical protein